MFILILIKKFKIPEEAAYYIYPIRFKENNDKDCNNEANESNHWDE